MADPIRIGFVLRFWLWSLALHSVAVGLGLIWHPAALLGKLGYIPCSEPFFPVQGGVFHIVMAVGYSMAAWDPLRFRCLVVFAIVVKVLATIFLIIYWIMNLSLQVVLLSGLADGAMALVLVVLYRRWCMTQLAKEQS
ncbi:MAG: hypothetical protein KAH56_01695 [Candidatus Krumholzibacteria bacterium]|nr:hypothetical protein [Candidatus Krumholzibacteria bacterium]